MERQKKKQHQIKIELDDSVGQGEYVNLAIVTHSPAEFLTTKRGIEGEMIPAMGPTAAK